MPTYSRVYQNKSKYRDFENKVKLTFGQDCSILRTNRTKDSEAEYSIITLYAVYTANSWEAAMKLAEDNHQILLHEGRS